MKHTFKYEVLFIFFALGLFSCSKQIDDAYQNPNADTKVPPETLLPQIIASMAANYAGHGPANDARYIGAYVQNFALCNPNSNFDQQGYTNTDVAQSTWRTHYYDIGQNCMKMIEWAKDEQKWDYVGVGQAIFAWSWLTLADYYGEVIVKEAFNTNLITFKFDTQEDAYNKSKEYAFAALENLNRTDGNVSQANLALGDAYFYNGDVNKWKKFVNSMLARYYNHFSNKSSYKADSVIFYANNGITNSADDAMVKFAATALSATNSFFGPLRNNLTGTGVTSPTAIRQSAYIANLMNGTNAEFSTVEDPRAWYLLRGNTAGTIRGVEQNAGQNALVSTDRPENFWGQPQTSSTPSNIAPTVESGRYIFRNAAPFPVITAAEVHFMKAEAALRKGDRTTALQAYRDGISNNFDMLTSTFNVNIPVGKEITEPVKTTFLSNTTVVPATEAGLNMSKIMLQKFIAMYAYGALETWMDMRRFHYTDIDAGTGNQVYRDLVIPTLFPDNGGKTVQRMRPRFNSEYVWNRLELERIGATTNDYHVKELWITQP